MKRIFSLLLCLALLLSVTACKPDNITPPVEIVDPSEQEESKKPAKEETNSKEEEKKEDKEEEKKEETKEKEEPAPEKEEQKKEEEPKDTAEPKPEEEQREEEKPAENPLAAKDFIPSATTASTLSASGLIKKGEAVSALKNRTIVVYTADNLPAFSYTDASGKEVVEWQWMQDLAEENGFMLKYNIKNDAVAVKSQRIALFAGKKLSLVQIKSTDLADGLSLCRSALDYLDTAAQSFGISKAVLTQSNHALFAPVGNVNALWYNPTLLPEGSDPAALAETNAWTVEEFAKICTTVSKDKKLRPLILQETLAWATLSGRSPLTLLEGKLDSNINAGVTRNVWSVYKDLKIASFQKNDSNKDYALKSGNTAFHYTARPEAGEGMVPAYAPLPALEKDTPGTVTFTGTFFGLPKYGISDESAIAALTFAELWCNRYTEARAAALHKVGVTEKKYLEFCDMAEDKGVLILHNSEIEAAVETYLKGLSDPAVDMVQAYANAKPLVDGLVAAHNVHYDLTA